MKRKKAKKGDRLFDIVNYLLLGILALIILYPMYFVVIASISDPTLVNSGKVLFYPKGITFEGYKLIFERNEIWRSYANTIQYTVFGTALGVVVTMLVAYCLSRHDFEGRNFLMAFLMITMYFGGGLIPTYLLMSNLGLVNTRWILILMGSVSVFNIIMARTFLQSSLSPDLFEAAVLDGCSDIKYFIKIVLPLSKAIIAVLVLYYGVAHWNDYFNGLIYTTDEELQPLQLVLRSILVTNQLIAQDMTNIENALEAQRIVEVMKYGLIIVSSIPVLIVYPFVQKYFNQGVMIGSVKG